MHLALILNLLPKLVPGPRDLRERDGCYFQQVIRYRRSGGWVTSRRASQNSFQTTPLPHIRLRRDSCWILTIFPLPYPWQPLYLPTVFPAVGHTCGIFRKSRCGPLCGEAAPAAGHTHVARNSPLLLLCVARNPPLLLSSWLEILALKGLGALAREP